MDGTLSLYRKETGRRGEDIGSRPNQIYIHHYQLLIFYPHAYEAGIEHSGPGDF